MTEDEELEYLRLKAKAAQASAAPKPKEEKKEQSTADKWAARTSNFASGLTLGLGDELAGIGSMLGNTAYDLIEGDGWQGTDRLNELYTRGVEQARAKERQFAEENPWEAAGIEMAGSIASPLNLIAPGSGLARATGRAALEGGAYGFNEAEGDMGERLAAAPQSAAISGGVGAGLGVLGRVVGKGFANAPDLGRGESFTPLNMAAPETPIGQFYQKAVGTAYGGRPKIRDQEARALRRTLGDLVDDAAPDAHSGSLRTAALERIGGEEIAEQAAIRAARDQAIDETSDQAFAASSRYGDDIADLQAQKSALPTATQLRRDAVDRATLEQAALRTQREQLKQQAAEEVAGIGAGLRTQQAQAAIPDLADPAVLALRDQADNLQTTADVNKFMGRLDDYWTNQAFNRIKESKLPIDRPMLNAIEGVLGEDYKVYQDVLEEAMEAGQGISGKFLMDIRNNPARASNTANAYTRGEKRQIVQAMDTQIERALTKQAKAARTKGAQQAAVNALDEFNKQKAAYGDFVDFRNAVSRRTNQKDLAATFGPEELGRVGKGKSMNTGTRPSLERSRAAIDAQDAAKAAAQRRSSQLANRERRLTQRAKAEANRGARTVEQERRALNQTIRKLRNERRDAGKALSDKRTEARRTATQGLEKTKAQARAQREMVQEALKGAAPDSASTATQLVSTALLGGPLAAASLAGAPIGGYFMAKGLASEGAQRALVGQSRFQELMRKAAQGDMQAEILLNRILSGYRE